MNDSPYERGLGKRPANYSALTPTMFLKRSAWIFPHKTAVIDDDGTLSYAALYARCRRMASALQGLGIRHGDTVSTLLFNSHEMLESHYSIPMAGAVLNALNIRLDAATLRFILEHGESKALLYDTEFEALVREVVQGMARPPVLVAVAREAPATPGVATHDYETLLADGDAGFDWRKPEDEWEAISLCYTSGTTSDPKGVVYHHRGAYLSALGNAMAFNMTPDTVYLWTLPMFHCNGWCYTWAITAVGGTHVCLRKVRSDEVLRHLREHHITHMCGAPVVLNQLLNDFAQQGVALANPVQFALGGAAPPNAVIAKAQTVGFRITHLYGLTESYGPSTVCVWQDDWASLDGNALAAKMARQGVGLYAMDDVQVLDRETDAVVPADGRTLGELVHRGNTLMKGYLKNPEATEQAFCGDWFRTGDLAVMHSDGYVEIKDRAKDIIISGGENISSKEVEDVLYAHPAVLEAAVVARPDSHWGEVPCAFVALKNGEKAPTEQEIIDFCRAGIASFKIPKQVVFGPLPKTSTGKILKTVLRERIA
ncbi:AMP-binding protein [Comamonas badia]|uniref:AMP-binding protein n=1 Tax=Comamonas badia TaxID=265291 RepID=UPI000415C867|nr:AMP-binding protein [Comamonas badia]